MGDISQLQRCKMMRPLRNLFILIFLVLGVVSFPLRVYSSAFIPSKPVMAVQDLRPGMKGEALTVIQGQKIVSFPVEIISVIPKKGIPRNFVMIRATGPVIKKTGGIASGMSGSPVYIQGKLIGAIGYGWNFTEHDLGLVTPIEDMVSIWEWPERIPEFTKTVQLQTKPEKEKIRSDPPSEKEKETFSDLLLEERGAPLMADGLSPRSLENIGNLLHRDVLAVGGSGSTDLPVIYRASIFPGQAIGVLLAWGDVTMGATGTITSVSRDGRFVGFAHPFLNRGNVAYPLTTTWVHSVVPSIQAPFKVGTPLQIIGSVTQDRPQAIGGRIGVFLPSVDVSVSFSDMDTGSKSIRKFHVVYDPFMISEILPEMVAGIIDETWGRNGEGTARVNVKVEGGGLHKGWKRSNYFFSDKDTVKECIKEISEITRIVSLNPFQEIVPLGIHVDVELTYLPKILFIEDLNVEKKEVKPGDEVSVEVKLRPYRKSQVLKKYTLNVPEDAFGPCEILVRGGGIAELGQETIAQGYQSISSFSQMLREMNAKEANNEVILEILCEKNPVSQLKEQDEEELLSEVKARRIKEGTLRIFKSDYYVEGLLRKTIYVNTSKGAKETSP